MRKLKKFKFDIFLIILLVGALVTWLVVWIATSSNDKKKAIIEYNNDVVLELSLSEDKEIRLKELSNGKTLEYEMLIVVENGTIRVQENECPNHDCIKEGKKDKIGDVIICLPNKIVIKVVKA